MKRFLLDVTRSTAKLVCVLSLLAGGAALANYAATQGSGTNFGSIVVSAVHYMQMLACDPTTPANCATVKAGNSAVTTDVAIEVADPNVVSSLTTINNSINSNTTMFSALSTASITRPANTTTYTANTAWCTTTSACPIPLTFTSVCRVNGGEILIPQIDIWSSANQSTKLQGVLWLFDATVGTIINDDATFTIAAADFANLTGNQQGFAFTMTNTQAGAAANAGISLTGTTYHAQCQSGATSILGMVQVVNAYVPLSGEVLHVAIHSVGVN